MVPITRLDDPCLVALFKQLPPADQLTARKVCRRWANLVTNAAQSTRLLAIFVGDLSLDGFEKYVNVGSLGTISVVSLLQKEDGSPMFPLERFSQWNALLFRGGLDEAAVEAIDATFVNLNTLQIGLFKAPSAQFDFITRLLELWAHRQLTTLKLFELSSYFRETDFLDHFFAAINGISTLKHLILNLITLPYHNMPVISQLEQLRFNWNECRPYQFAAMLREHATANISLRSIEYLGNYLNSSIGHFTSLGDHLLSRFTRFGVHWNTFTNFELIITHFSQLTCLNIRPTATTIRLLFRRLRKLTQLLYLQLDINFASILPDDQPRLTLPQLLSVRALQLNLTIRSHRQLEQLKINRTMPDVEAIQIYLDSDSRCTDCAIEFDVERMQANPGPFNHCLYRMFVQLKRTCTQLRAIRHDHEHILDTAEELLAD